MVSELKERASKLLLEVNKIINECDATNEDGIYEGNIGLCIYYFYYANLLNISSIRERAEVLLNEIFEKIQEGKSSLAGYNLSNGIIGYCLLLHILNEEEFIEIDLNESLSEIDVYIYNACLADINDSKIDNLHQALGGLYYFTVRKDFPNKIYYLETLVDALYTKRTVDHLGVRFLSSSGPNVGKIYDLSFAHGLGGMLHILLKVFSCNIRKELISEIVSDGLKFIMNFENKDPATNSDVVFPIFINADNMQPHYSSMLGWCYGDLNILLLLLEMKEIDFSHDYNAHIDVLITSIGNRSLHLSRIKDSHLCHGSSGLYLVMKYLYELSNDYRFYESSQKWFEIFETHLINDLKENLYQGKEHQLLEGLVGVGLVCLSIIWEKEAIWKKTILL